MADAALLKKADIGFLITHIGKQDNHLFQALNKLSSAIVDVGTIPTSANWFEVAVDASGSAVPDISKGYTQNVIATLDVTIANPVRTSQVSWILRFVQDTTGGWTLSFDTDFIGVANLAILTDPNTRTMIHFTVRPDGKSEMNFISTGLAI